MTNYDHLLYATDSYLRSHTATVVELDEPERRVGLTNTIIYPGGGGQPADRGTLHFNGSIAQVTRVAEADGVLWHWLDGPLPSMGLKVEQRLDWERRLLLMRTHSALHVICGVLYRAHGAQVTGANMEPGTGRLDFALPELTGEHARELEQEINDEIANSYEINVLFLPRHEADNDPALIRAKVNLIPASIDPLRVVDIVGLDRQADGGTHVANTGEIGQVAVKKIENKGAANKRVRIALADSLDGGARAPAA